MIFLAVFDHRQLQRKPHLRSGEPHARRFVHARSHGFDQFLDFAAAYFLDTQRPGALPQNGVSGLDDFKFHGTHYFRSRADANRALMDFNSICKDIRGGHRRKSKIAQ
jgi:hypothetical protein